MTRQTTYSNDWPTISITLIILSAFTASYILTTIHVDKYVDPFLFVIGLIIYVTTLMQALKYGIIILGETGIKGLLKITLTTMTYILILYPIMHSAQILAFIKEALWTIKSYSSLIIDTAIICAYALVIPALILIRKHRQHKKKQAQQSQNIWPSQTLKNNNLSWRFAQSKSSPYIMYHGTPTMAGAQSILQENKWILGPATPKGIWLTPDIEVAKGYTGNGAGAIVEVRVDPRLAQLANYGQKRFYRQTEEVEVGDEFRVPGITPIRIITN